MCLYFYQQTTGVEHVLILAVLRVLGNVLKGRYGYYVIIM